LIHGSDIEQEASTFMSWSSHTLHFDHTPGSMVLLSTAHAGVKLRLNPVQPEEVFDSS